MLESFLTFSKEWKKAMHSIEKKYVKNYIPNVNGTIKKDFNLSKLTWFKVGGRAEVFFTPKDKDDLINFLKKLDKDAP